VDWEEYARVNPLGPDSYHAEPVQDLRVNAIVARARGHTLDVGGGDGYIASQLPDVTMVDISPTRVARAQDQNLSAMVGDACDLPFPDDSYDTVILGEVLEHLADPGPAFAEAFRVARDRVIMSIPLDGWADPTHQWRISLDDCVDPIQKSEDPTKGRQLVITWQRGTCWPRDYAKTDPSWVEQFVEGH